jgi:cellulose biosynthesis protein BcsQ
LTVPTSFDDVIPALLRVGTSNPVLTNAKRVAVVRDPVGRVRLAVDAPDAAEAERDALEESLQAALGDWYAGPPLFTDAGPAQKRLASQILQRAEGRWPQGWPREATDPIRGSTTPIDATRWGALQRVLSKETWLSEQEVTSPWPLHAKTPTVVSFYSYKGGVGRSTLVAVVAAILSRAGDDVVVIDLDLEAPGQQALFDRQPERGVLDYLVEHLALGQGQLEGLFADVSPAVEEPRGSLQLAAAGATGWSYVEKVARLDFVGHTQEGSSPVQAALHALLSNVRSEYDPDWILLDARTGIHDLGGLAMHALAHIDVLMAREGRQGSDGLKLCLDALARRRKVDDILTLVVHALAPAPLSDTTISVPVQERFRDQVFDLFLETVYRTMSEDEIPAMDDDNAPHTPYPIPLDPTLGRIEKLSEMSDSLTRDHYARIVERLRELAAPSGGS